MKAILEEAEGPLTRAEIVRRWPESSAVPAKVTLWKWLARLVEAGQVLRQGQGTKKEPHRYLLPGMMAKWQAKVVETLLAGLGATEA